MARLWRVYHPGLRPAVGESIELGSDESLHVRRVLRLQPGEPIALFDGEGNEWRAAILRSDRGGVRVRLEEALTGEVEPAIEILLYQGLCTADRMDWLVQKATEVGVSAIFPFVAERTGRRIATPHRLDRWRRIAVEACKQSGRRRVPRIDLCATLPAPVPAGPLALLLDGAPGVAPLADGLASAAGRLGCIWLAVGPEGGFESSEIEAWARAGWRPAGLGPRTLRAETAGVVATSILLHLCGDLGSAFGANGDC